ncbi:unnamed protein product [Penicillium discolor]
MIGNSQLFLLGLQGTEVTLPSSDSLKIRGDTWVIDKKLNEVSCMITHEDLDSGRTVPSYTMGKFLCHKGFDILRLSVIIKTPAKLIWDHESCQLHISGFSTAIKVNPTKEWNDNVFVMYQLVKRPKMGWEDIARWER